MTIRYECQECESVLKIKDEKAGQQGKCPKCKSEFTIPEPVAAAVPKLTADDMVDMPLELTPAVVIPRETISASDEFDPLGVLNSDSAHGIPLAADEYRPSVAELMQEHQQKRARDGARKSKRKQKKANPLMVAEVETSGSAADAITRTYEKKRAEASNDQPVTREQRRAAEQRTAMMRFGLQLSGVLLTTIVFGYFLVGYMSSKTYPNLVNVTGSISAQTKSFAGMRIRFIPIKEPGAPDLLGGPSAAMIDPDGSFELIYKPGVPGAITGKHQLVIEDSIGIEFPLPDEFSVQEVTADGNNNFELNL